MKTVRTDRRRALALGASLLLGPLHARAQAVTPTYPARPVTLIVPYAAGGPTDVAVRALAAEGGKLKGSADYRQYAQAAFERERGRVAQLRARGVLK